MEPRVFREVMTAVTLKELVTVDDFRLSLRVSARKGKKQKYMRDLLPHLFQERPILRTNHTLPHLMGDQAVDLTVDNTVGWMLQAARALRAYLMETWQLKPVKRLRKWNLHFSLTLTNPEGLVVLEVPVANWTEKSMHDYIKLAGRARRLTTHDELFSRAFLPEQRSR
jgi:hypothetical protein